MDLAQHEVVARSVLDRATAAADDAERRWPHNQAVLCDALVEVALLGASIGPDSQSAWGADAPPDRLTLLWPANGSAVPVGVGDDVAKLARQSYPLAPRQRATCDRCDDEAPIYGALLFALGAKFIGLVFCGDCARDLTVAGYQPTWTFRDPEPNRPTKE